MCDVTRRNLLLASAITGGVTAVHAQDPAGASSIDKVDPVANGVYFHHGDVEKHGHCNNGWIIFKDPCLISSFRISGGYPRLLPMVLFCGLSVLYLRASCLWILPHES